MKKIVRLSENNLIKLVKKVINEQGGFMDIVQQKVTTQRQGTPQTTTQRQGTPQTTPQTTTQRQGTPQTSSGGAQSVQNCAPGIEGKLITVLSNNYLRWGIQSKDGKKCALVGNPTEPYTPQTTTQRTAQSNQGIFGQL